MLLIIVMVIAVILIAAITSEVGKDMDNAIKFSCAVCKYNKLRETEKIRCIAPFGTSCKKVKEEYIEDQSRGAKRG